MFLTALPNKRTDFIAVKVAIFVLLYFQITYEYNTNILQMSSNLEKVFQLIKHTCAQEK